MNSTVGILARIPLFKLYRKFGWPQLLPLNLTLSPSPKCNSRCLTCNIWMKRENELTIEEWDKVLASLGQAPYWFTISGGEPLRGFGVQRRTSGRTDSLRRQVGCRSIHHRDCRTPGGVGYSRPAHYAHSGRIREGHRPPNCLRRE